MQKQKNPKHPIMLELWVTGAAFLNRRIPSDISPERTTDFPFLLIEHVLAARRNESDCTTRAFWRTSRRIQCAILEQRAPTIRNDRPLATAQLPLLWFFFFTRLRQVSRFRTYLVGKWGTERVSVMIGKRYQMLLQELQPKREKQSIRKSKIEIVSVVAVYQWILRPFP